MSKARRYPLEKMGLYLTEETALLCAQIIEATLPEEPPYEALKALAGEPLILAASDEEWARGRYKAMRDVMLDMNKDEAK